jgi:hypothetical protein
MIKTPKIIIACQHNKHRNVTEGDLRGVEVSGMLGVALGEAIRAAGGVGKEHSFVKVLYTPADEKIEYEMIGDKHKKCSLDSFIYAKPPTIEHECTPSMGGSIGARIDALIQDESNEVVWIIDLHTYLADPWAPPPNDRGWVDYVDTVVFMHPAAITALDTEVEIILENIEDKKEPEREVNVWLESERHNCVLDAHSAKIKCVVMDFAVIEREDDLRSQERLAANVTATAKTLAAHFVEEPAFVKYKESMSIALTPLVK